MFNHKKIDTIADYFIDKNNLEKKGLTNKKLQKLLYYSQAWNLVFNKKKLFNENIEAWMHGPAIPYIYFKYKEFGFNDIKKEIEKNNFAELSKEERELLDSVWNTYGNFDADYLEMLSHSEDPWREARKNIAPYESSDKIISLDKMQRYYEQKIQKV